MSCVFFFRCTTEYYMICCIRKGINGTCEPYSYYISKLFDAQNTVFGGKFRIMLCLSICLIFHIIFIEAHATVHWTFPTIVISLIDYWLNVSRPTKFTRELRNRTFKADAQGEWIRQMKWAATCPGHDSNVANSQGIIGAFRGGWHH